MKYKLIIKKFESKEDIEIPDNAFAIAYSGMVKLRTETIDTEWLGIHSKGQKTVWGYQFEWLEPDDEDNHERKT